MNRAPAPDTTSAPDPELRRPYLSWLALGCSVLLSIVAWSVSSRTITDRLRDQFTLRSEQIALAITGRMQEHESVLRGGVALFVASREVTRTEFRDYFEHLDLALHYPGIQGIGFVRLVPHGQLPEVIAAVRDEGFVDFQVFPPGERTHYTPITYIEPFSGSNLRAFGFDMFSEQRRREAMERAWRTGQPSATAMLRLVQDTPTDHQPGFLLYLPVFYGEPKTEEARKRQIFGFIYSPLRTYDLMHGILGQGPSDIDFALYEEGATQSFFDTRDKDSTDHLRSEQSARRTLSLGGRTWTLRLWSRPNFGSWVWRSEPLAVLAAGAVINLLLLYILANSATIQRRAHSLAEEMTHELKQSHAREQSHMLSSLREKETLLKEIHHRVKNNLQVVSSLLSLQRNYTHDERALEPLRQSQQRVLAMAALHEFLYQSSDLARVDTKSYLTHLVSMLSESHPGARNVTLSLTLDNVPLDVDRAIPCGLILNELVSNAYKYAFGDGRAGCLEVSLVQRDSQVELRVRDDGPGLPAETDLELPSTLGLSLVQLLSQQLGGTLRIERAPHPVFTIVFPFTPVGAT